MLSLSELSALVDAPGRFDLLRVQTLERYDVESDGGDYRRYLDGEAAPTPERKGAWLERLRSSIEAGRAWRNVHVLRTPLSDYLRYACEWGYAINATTGQQLRVLELPADELAAVARVGDFWVMDRELVVQMHYDDGGRFLGADLVSGQQGAAFRALADALWRQAEPFGTWWAAHPQFHRGGKRVA